MPGEAVTGQDALVGMVVHQCFRLETVQAQPIEGVGPGFGDRPGGQAGPWCSCPTQNPRLADSSVPRVMPLILILPTRAPDSSVIAKGGMVPASRAWRPRNRTPTSAPPSGPTRRAGADITAMTIYPLLLQLVPG